MPNAEKIRESLVKHKINDSLIQQIMEGYDELSPKANKEQKAAFLIRCIERMDQTIELEVRKEILEWCACCKSGARAKDIRNFVKENTDKSLKEKIIGLNHVKNMGTPQLNADGSISCWIVLKLDDEYKCPCPNFNGVKIPEPVSSTYCYCCAGHFLHHYQKALGVRLEAKVISSALESAGLKPCQFRFEIVN